MFLGEAGHPWGEQRVVPAFVFPQPGEQQVGRPAARPRRMSLHSWDKEYEDRTSSEPTYSIASVYQFDVDEDLKGSERQEGSEYSEEPSSTFHSDVPHVVPWKLIISLAFPAQLSHKVKYTRLIEKYRKHPRLENPAVKAHRFCHIEYFLLPDDTEPKKVDLVIFPAVAKVFLESGVKIVKLWEEGDRVWVSWTQTFNINVTKELLKKISVHKITLKLWNTKDKISRKVRYGLKTAGSLDDLGSVGKPGVPVICSVSRNLWLPTMDWVFLIHKSECAKT